ncbi:FHA domain-containing protein [Pleionea sediminis]|uniref:FHA domain-containing protein n=1 Tax=Pleionea sediminis TaxID=2569479 RepID=UPI001185F24D|nr:FHA domain-containing protein [Pleionea sediminis]
MAYLVLISDGETGPRFTLDKECLSIGRSSDCDIHLEDPSVSFEHAQLNIKQGFGEVWIEDANSTNGTFVNNKKVQSSPLRHNDNINIGLSNFRFVSDEESLLESTQEIKKSWIPGIFYLKDKS